MSGLELPTVTATGAAWFAWEPITPGECMTLVALLLAAWGLWLMRTTSTVRNRQIDAQTRMMDERTAALVEGMRAMTYGLETVIERTAPGAGRESA